MPSGAPPSSKGNNKAGGSNNTHQNAHSSSSAPTASATAGPSRIPDGSAYPANLPLTSDPATNAMVLSRLQGFNPQQNQQFALPNGFGSPGTSSQAGIGTDTAGNTSSPDFNALLASLGGYANVLAGSGGGNDAQSPGFANADQLRSPSAHTNQNSKAAASTSTAKSSAHSNPAEVDKSKKASSSSTSATSKGKPTAEDPGTMDDGSGRNNMGSASWTRQVPPFLNKLRSMVDEKGTDDMIHWQPEGKTFVIPNTIRFAKEVLPQFFKHNNFSSFVRQLNMYGFHKVASLQQGSLKYEQELEVWEFEHENFVRDEPDLMANMQRKRGHKGDDKDERDEERRGVVEGNMSEGLNSVSGALMRAGDTESLMQLANVWQSIQSIQGAQNSINDNLRHLTMSNDSLWREAAESKRRADQQADTINRMLRFLAGVFGGQDVLSSDKDGSSGISPSRNRKRPGPHSELFRSNSSSNRLMIQGGNDAQYPVPGGQTPEDTHGNADGSAQIQELFSRNSEAGSNEPTPRGSQSPPEGSASPRSRLTQIRTGGKSNSPFDDSASRRPSTPGGRNRMAGNPLWNMLQQAFNAQGTPSRPGTPRPSTPGPGNAAGGPGGNQPKMDPQFLAALLAMAQSQGHGQQTGNNDEDPFADSSTSGGGNVIYPYQSPDPGSDGNANSGLSNAGFGNSDAFSQQLASTLQDNETVQRAINSLVDHLRTNSGGLGTPSIEYGANSSSEGGSNGHTAGLNGFAPGLLPSGGTTPLPSSSASLPVPGDWNQFAGNALTPGNVQLNGSSSNDLDMDALLSQFIDSPAASQVDPPTTGSTNPSSGLKKNETKGSSATSPRKRKSLTDADGVDGDVRGDESMDTPTKSSSASVPRAAKVAKTTPSTTGGSAMKGGRVTSVEDGGAD